MENCSLSAAELLELLAYLCTQQSNGLPPQILSILSNLEAAHTGSQLHMSDYRLASPQSGTSSSMPDSTIVHPSAGVSHLHNSENGVNQDSVSNQTQWLQPVLKSQIHSVQIL